MTITFANGKSFEYISAFALEKDYKNGYTRPSIEISLSLEQTSYNEIESIVNSAAVRQFTLKGDETTTDANGNTVTVTPPTADYLDYTIPGKITVEDGVITFKLYKLSDMEIENRQAIATIDQLLIAMEE